MSRTPIAQGEHFFSNAQTLLRLWDLLEHPLHRHWSASTLAHTELATYAAQYEHAVVALAKVAEIAAAEAPPNLRHELGEHARAEADHVELWQRFRAALPRPVDTSPTAETIRCSTTWIGRDKKPLERHLAVLYAIKTAQARVSGEALAAGSNPDANPALVSPSLAVHAELHAQRALHARRVLAPLLTSANASRLVQEVGAALHTQWELLTGVQRLCTTPAGPVTDRWNGQSRAVTSN